MAKLHQGIDAYRVRSAISAFNSLNRLGVFNDTDINAISTGIVGLKGLITNAINKQKVHIEHVTLCRAGLEAVNEMVKLGELTDSNINNVSTGYAGLLALISDEAPSGDDTNQARGDWTYSGNVAQETFIG
ncbi:MAG: hypothetical protein AB1489_24580 [Acidobacteriota bacterium]